MATVFSVGHSTHPVDKFIDLLRSHMVEVVADVRSSPFSRMNPQFNRDDLKKSLKDAEIRYVFLGKELGARSDDPACYVGSKVSYDLLAQTELFQQGLERVIEGAKTYRLALMCAEKDPLHCHRTILVARELIKRGLDVAHILDNGRLERHSEAMERLMTELKVSGDDMFRSKEDGLIEAYAKQADKIAYDSSDPKYKGSPEAIPQAERGSVS